MKKDFAVTSSEKLVFAWCTSLQFLAQLQMIVNLTIYAKHEIASHIVQWLVTTVRVNDGKALMSDDGVSLAVHATPIRPPVAQKFCSINYLLTYLISCLEAKKRKNAAHEIG